MSAKKEVDYEKVVEYIRKLEEELSDESLHDINIGIDDVVKLINSKKDNDSASQSATTCGSSNSATKITVRSHNEQQADMSKEKDLYQIKLVCATIQNQLSTLDNIKDEKYQHILFVEKLRLIVDVISTTLTMDSISTEGQAEFTHVTQLLNKRINALVNYLQ